METVKGATSRLFTCDCYHPWQDARYGSKRVHNEMQETGKWRCTVCGGVKDKGSVGGRYGSEQRE